jgi:hypothetical protein
MISNWWDITCEYINTHHQYYEATRNINFFECKFYLSDEMVNWFLISRNQNNIKRARF